MFVACASVLSPFLAEAVLTAVCIFFELNTFLCHLRSAGKIFFSILPDYEELRVYRGKMWW